MASVSTPTVRLGSWTVNTRSGAIGGTLTASGPR